MYVSFTVLLVLVQFDLCECDNDIVDRRQSECAIQLEEYLIIVHNVFQQLYLVQFETLTNEQELYIKYLNSKLISEPQFRKVLVIICFMSRFVCIISPLTRTKGSDHITPVLGALR